MTRTPPATDGLRAVLIDYGGTLDGDALHWFDHFVALYAEAGADVPLSALKAAFYDADAALTRDPEIAGFGLERMVRTHVELQLRALSIASPPLGSQIAERFIADTRAAWNQNRPLLQRLAARYRLGVVSNSYGNMPTLLSEAALAPFAVIIDSAAAGVSKPDPAIYRLAVYTLDLPPVAILHVGDSWERDVVPAHAVGMHTAWLARPEAPAPSEPNDVWRIDSLQALGALA